MTYKTTNKPMVAKINTVDIPAPHKMNVRASKTLDQILRLAFLFSALSPS